VDRGRGGKNLIFGRHKWMALKHTNNDELVFQPIFGTVEDRSYMYMYALVRNSFVIEIQ